MKRKSIIIVLIMVLLPFFSGCGENSEDAIVLRVSNWEEYIDLGGWDEEEKIELENGETIFGENNMIEDFENWYQDTYGKKVRVEYSTFGTNEDLYNQIQMGDSFDLVCPSEYMIMKMYRENMLIPYSEDFYDTENELNYYSRGVSPYIEDTFSSLDIGDGAHISDYAAGYMWGNLGIVYNPEYISEEEASHWNLLINEKYRKQVTVKDSIRDTYFGGMGILNYDELVSSDFVNAPNHKEKLAECFNRSDEDTVAKVEQILTKVKDNAYSFEVDSGKADMATGKTLANVQWSGDAVYTLDSAEEDDLILNYAVPTEGANMWFDGWVMMRDGLSEDNEKQHVAEAFVNYVSRPDNVVRNMYYIGYTSVIAGGKDEAVLDYAKYVYEAEDEEGAVEYPLGYFFTGDDADAECIILTDEDQVKRQLFSQYPPKDVMDRCAVMKCFSDEDNERINQMWINVRCASSPLG